MPFKKRYCASKLHIALKENHIMRARGRKHNKHVLADKQEIKTGLRFESETLKEIFKIFEWHALTEGRNTLAAVALNILSG